VIKGTKLHLGVQEPGEKVETYKSLRLDLFHDRENVKDAVSDWVDQLYDEYGVGYESEGVKSESVE
jgi:hypothetical protein